MRFGVCTWGILAFDVDGAVCVVYAPTKRVSSRLRESVRWRHRDREGGLRLFSVYVSTENI